MKGPERLRLQFTHQNMFYKLLVGMGALPLRFMDDQNAESLGLGGSADLRHQWSGRQHGSAERGVGQGDEGWWESDRIQGQSTAEYPRGSELLSQRRDLAYGVVEFGEVIEKLHARTQKSPSS